MGMKQSDMDDREFNDFRLPPSRCLYEAKRLVIADLLQRSYEVFENVDPDNLWLVVRKDGRLHRVKVNIKPDSGITPGEKDELDKI